MIRLHQQDGCSIYCTKREALVVGGRTICSHSNHMSVNVYIAAVSNNKDKFF